ncbi:MAG: phosphate ABC transporter permease PstA [Candidatus Competibacteraceae bacterium]
MSNHSLTVRKDTTALIRAGIQRRHAAEKRFKWYGLIALSLGLLTVVLLFADIAVKAWPAFRQTSIRLAIYFDPEILYQDGRQDPQTLATADYSQLWKKALRQDFPEVTERAQLRPLYGLISSGATFQLQEMVMADPSLVGQTRNVWLLASDTVDSFFKGSINRAMSEDTRPLKDNQVAWLDRLEEHGRVETHFNTLFFTNGDSREPELAGIRGALVGSFYTILITLALSFPIAVAAAIYLEEFAARNRWTDLIEVNINNLAAVPSIIFGLLGLAIFINFFGLPRSTPIVGSLVLTLMTLPVMIIAGRVALKSVPPSIREAALGMGASRLQTVTDHVLPLAMPGILTGSILGMARALGETAPLLMIGMIAFVVDVPHSPLQPATVLPVQIFLWADLPERAFVERTSAAIIVLLAFLAVMNATAVILRRRFERRW